MAMSKENVSKFQDVIRCDLCIESAALLHCDACQVYVCHACVGNHITTDISKQHVVVECKKRSKIKLTECKSHSSQRCDLPCKQCNVPVCSKCMASTHAHHTVIDILDFCKSKQEEIRRDNAEIESMKMSKLKSANSELKEQIVNLPQRYAKTKEDIVQHGKEWHKQVDVIINTLTESVDKMMNVDLNTLRDHQQKLEETISLADQILQENTTILKSRDASAFDMYASRVDEVTNFSLNFDIKVPRFLPITFDRENMKNCFGSLISSSVEVERNRSMAENMKSTGDNISSKSDVLKVHVCEGILKKYQKSFHRELCQHCNLFFYKVYRCDVCRRRVFCCDRCVNDNERKCKNFEID